MHHSPLVSSSLSLLTKLVSTYPPNTVCMSFNGGKDCTVVLQLLRMTLDSLCNQHDVDNVFTDSYDSFSSVRITRSLSEIRIVYFHNPNEFPEVLQFIDEIERVLGICIQRMDGGFKEGVKVLVNEGVKVFLMGQRRGDPDGKDLKVWEKSSPGWPDFLRMNPILEWTCKDVWDFLLQNNLPYCKLYADGYTSLGSTNNTQRNPHLRNADGTYRHARFLENDEYERAGRLETSH